MPAPERLRSRIVSTTSRVRQRPPWLAGLRGIDQGGVTVLLLDPTQERPPLAIDLDTDRVDLSWQRVAP